MPERKQLIVQLSASARLPGYTAGAPGRYDAWDDAGNCCIILANETDFKSFEYQQ